MAADLAGAGYAPWWDQRHLDPYADFTAELETAIARAGLMVVCVTAGATRADSFVRREIAYAMAFGKPIIPAILDGSLPPIGIINLTRVEFQAREWEIAFADLLDRIRRPVAQIAARTDPFEPYLKAVYQGIVAFLAQAVRHYLHLHADSTPDAVPRPDGGRGKPDNMLRQLFIGHGFAVPDVPERFTGLAGAVQRFGGRVLLLGEPGSGKTIALIAHARDAVAERLHNRFAPLPLLGLLSTWAPSASISEWLASGYADLDANEVARVIESGEALLLLDGLDEVSAPSAEIRDRQAQILAALPANNSIVLTSRSREYRQIGTRAALAGAVTLQSVSDEQVNEFLADLPELRHALHDSPDLHAMVATPLLLNLIAETCRELSPTERAGLLHLTARPGDLRDFLVERYVVTRYRWEERRAVRQDTELPFSLANTLSYLGRLAMENAGTFRKRKSREGWHRGSHISANVLHAEDFRLAVAGDDSAPEAFVRFARQLDVILEQAEGSLSFRHLLVRDALAFPYSLRNLYDRHLYGTVVEVANPVEALARTGKSRAVDPLIELLRDERQPPTLRECASGALGFTADRRAVDALLDNLKRRQFLFRTGDALGRLRDPRAFDPLIGLLESAGKYGKRGAAHGLARLGDPRAIPFLRAALARLESEDDAFTIDAIVDSLCRLGDPGVEALLEEMRHALKSSDPFVASRGAFHLGVRGDRRALELLLQLASDADPVVRAGTAEALGWSGFPSEAEEALQPLLADSEEVILTGRPVSHSAAEALKQIAAAAQK